MGQPGVLCVLAVMIAAPAHADRAKAQRHYNDGMALFTISRYDEAIKEFEAGFLEERRPGFLYNIAQAHRLAGRPELAIAIYRRYLDLAAPAGRDRADVEVVIREMEQHLAVQATIRPPQTPPHPAATVQLSLPAGDAAATVRDSAADASLPAPPSASAGVLVAAPLPAVAPARRRTWPIWVGVVSSVVVAGAVTAAVLATQPPSVHVLSGVGDAR